VSAQPVSATLPPSETVESLLSELIEMSSEMSHLREDLISKGVPNNTITALIERKRMGPEEEFVTLRESALRSAENTLGSGVISNDFLLEHLDRLVVLDQDMAHLRKIARGHEMDTRAINMLSQLVSANPGDRGERVLNCLVDYGRCLGIPVRGLRLVASNEEARPTSVLPVIDTTENDPQDWRRYVPVSIEILLGCAVTYAAISLLT